MRKLLRTSDKILIAAAFLGDLIYDLAKNSSRAYKTGGRLGILFGYEDDQAMTRATQRLLKSAYIKKVVKNNQPYLRISASGWDRFCRDFPLFKFQDKPWSGTWCVVNYDIPERQKAVRNSLREKLVSLGFGLWKKSAYISPHDFGGGIREWLKERGLDELVSVSASKDLTEDDKELTREVFKLDKLFDRYNELLERCEKKLKEERVLNQELNEYFAILLSDPLLPKELLPRNWPAFKLRRILFGKKG